MASTADTSSAATADQGGQSRGGRGRGRGGRGGPRGGFAHHSDRGEDRSRGEGGGRSRGRGRGRGGRGRGRGQDNHFQGATVVSNEQDATTAPPPPQPGGTGVFGARLTKDAQGNTQGESGSAPAAEDDDVEAEVCFICASPVSHNSVAPCNHRTCHICALRLRALYKTKACAHCRTEAATVIFTDDPEKRYEDYETTDFFRTDQNLGISYEKPEIFEDTVLLLRYNCPDESCDIACMGWPDLHRHVRSVHQKVMCDLCTRNKKVFTHEHELFTHQELRRHEKFGDDNPGAVDQSGFKGHPECGFCRQRFYGDDELFAHCRERHERCHLCDRRTGGVNPQYFMNYEALEQHFGKDHFPCLDSECLEKKFVVFDSEMDLKAHQLENHPNGLSKDARRDARRVDLSSFDYRPQYVEPRRGGGRRAGRGRDPNADPMPASSGGHMSRAEIAHQREREVHSAQSVVSRSFGGQLSQPDPTPAQATQRAPRNPAVTNAQPANGTSAPTSPRPAEALTPQEQARRLRHAAVTERASNLLRNDKVKLDEFRERISAYRKDNISAGDLIDAFFALFDTASDDLGKLVKELADIFEVPGKKDALLKAWSDWKAINEDYPSLPGPAGANTTAAGVLGQGVGASRVLKLKSSTAQSSRSAVSRQASWAGSATASSSNPFPSLPASRKPQSRAPPAPTPTWLAVRPAPSSSSPSLTPSASARASPAPSRNQSNTNLARGKDAFPALPAAKKPTSTVFSPGYTGSGVIRTISNFAGVNAWGGSSAPGSNGTNTPISPTDAEDGAATGKKKGNKGKKQMLFQWG
ncbi:hypothetical protein M409DRAFT_54765 [Zasmidium cellare ATCC 36951]|uniref:RING-type E3 ubiquitin transferase n=1 Tax=Zasmidium cellare ATCC 36951 TaxID=1080233 RepID=A0A6A6CGU4_ZASCE|nr:uncharacterized protein M409DRAFT_54765 [Zasmidium cellare ATCC 36951]KAF2166414.1 hypothetical protein M409DRAFT_54765 [Zasmidium cellare ATCC 36951]